METISKPGFGSGDSNGNGFIYGNGNGFGYANGEGYSNGDGFGAGQGDGLGNSYGFGFGDGFGDSFVNSNGSGHGNGYSNGDSFGNSDGECCSRWRISKRCSYENSKVFVSDDTPIIAWWRIGDQKHFDKPLPVEPGSVHEWPYEPVLCQQGLHACWRKEDTEKYGDGPLYRVACSGWVRTDGVKLVCTRRVVLEQKIMV